MQVYHTCHVKGHFASDKQTRCWYKLSKVTNQRVYQELVYRNDVLKQCLQALPSFSLSLPGLPTFSIVHCHWQRALEQAKTMWSLQFVFVALSLCCFFLRCFVSSLFVCRRKVCALLVCFYLLDVDILILGLEMPKKYVSCCFWPLICIAFFCNSIFVLVWVTSFIFCNFQLYRNVRTSNR